MSQFLGAAHSHGNELFDLATLALVKDYSEAQATTLLELYRYTAPMTVHSSKP